jgi:hypothetical protein
MSSVASLKCSQSTHPHFFGGLRSYESMKPSQMLPANKVNPLQLTDLLPARLSTRDTHWVKRKPRAKRPQPPRLDFCPTPCSSSPRLFRLCNIFSSSQYSDHEQCSWGFGAACLHRGHSSTWVHLYLLTCDRQGHDTAVQSFHHRSPLCLTQRYILELMH